MTMRDNDEASADHTPMAASVLAVRNCLEAIDHYLARFDIAGVHDVRSGIARWGAGEIRHRAQRSVAAVGHLPTALDCLASDGEVALAHAIGAGAPHLEWVTYDLYPAEMIGAAFAGGHAFASIIGEHAPIHADDFDLGLFIIAPHVFYRDHKHRAPELYAPLTGPHGWRFAPGDPICWKPAHEPVWNEAWQPHATRVGAVPFLGIFGWTRDVNEPAVVISSPDWDAVEQQAPARQTEIV